MKFLVVWEAFNQTSLKVPEYHLEFSVTWVKNSVFSVTWVKNSVLEFCYSQLQLSFLFLPSLPHFTNEYTFRIIISFSCWVLWQIRLTNTQMQGWKFSYFAYVLPSLFFILFTLCVIFVINVKSFKKTSYMIFKLKKKHIFWFLSFATWKKYMQLFFLGESSLYFEISLIESASFLFLAYS